MKDPFKKLFEEGKPKRFKLIDNSWETTPNYSKEQDRQGDFFIPNKIEEHISGVAKFCRESDSRDKENLIPEGICENPLTPDECYEYTFKGKKIIQKIKGDDPGELGKSGKGPIGVSKNSEVTGKRLDVPGKGLQIFDVRIPGSFAYPKDWTVRLEVPEEVDIDTVINDYLNKNLKEKEMWEKGELRLDLVRNGELFITCMYNRFKNED